MVAPKSKPEPVEKLIKNAKSFAKNSEYAQYMGYAAYRKAKMTSDKVREMGIVGSFMRGMSRDKIRKAYHISPRKLNRILDGDTVDDLSAMALNELFGLTNKALAAIANTLDNNNGVLAMQLLEKLGTFKESRRDRILGVKEDAQGEETQRSFGQIFFAQIQAGPVSKEIEEFTQDLIRNSESK